MIYAPITVTRKWKLIVTSNASTSAFTVHRHLGPGFREMIYERAFCLELDSRGVEFEC